MRSRLNPYIAFNGNARQAMEFYRDVFGGELEMGTYAEYGSPDAPADRIMHARLDTPNGYTLMAWDVRQGMPFHPGNNVAVYLGGDDAELHSYFERLSANGTVTLPLEKQSWGDEAGSLVDQFGITWMVNITHQDQQPSQFPADAL
ncbi:VOC family protein [Spirillospora sp. CA-294931]|uniref:VOC family protein n=1 Tax=Spirillospora sp. CA-294931 TaxID=3240042 RepID=UPI003D900250